MKLRRLLPFHYKHWLVPGTLSGARVALTPYIIYGIVSGNMHLAAYLCIMAVITIYFDSIVVQHDNTSQFFDVLADSLVILSIFASTLYIKFPYIEFGLKPYFALLACLKSIEIVSFYLVWLHNASFGNNTVKIIGIMAAFSQIIVVFIYFFQHFYLTLFCATVGGSTAVTYTSFVEYGKMIYAYFFKKEQS